MSKEYMPGPISVTRFGQSTEKFDVSDELEEKHGLSAGTIHSGAMSLQSTSDGVIVLLVPLLGLLLLDTFSLQIAAYFRITCNPSAA
jgi:hypothetical protein